MRILRIAVAVGLFAAIFPAVASADRINLDVECERRNDDSNPRDGG